MPLGLMKTPYNKDFLLAEVKQVLINRTRRQSAAGNRKPEYKIVLFL